MNSRNLWTVTGVLALLSAYSLAGAGDPAGPEIEFVRERRWLSNEDFVRLFAISRAASGPGTMLATLIGWDSGE